MEPTRWPKSAAGSPAVRYHIHFTPTSASWQNLVERLFGEVAERCVRRGSHSAVNSLEKAMLGYLDERNKDPKPFIWTAMRSLVRPSFDRRPACGLNGVVADQNLQR